MQIYYLISLIPLLFYLFFKTKYAFWMLQQNWYNDGNRYLKWLKNNFKVCFLSSDLFFVVMLAGLFLKPYITMALFVFLCLIFIILYRRKRNQDQKKIPLAFTSRIKRLTFTFVLIYLVLITINLLTFDEYYLTYYYLAFGLFAYLDYIIVYLVNIINKPLEKAIFKHFEHLAIKKLEAMDYMRVIGITGSYGKTSCKNILYDILSVKYNVFKTPKNFNTHYGLINAINNYLDKFNDYFIAEMGAFKRGEIKELCDLVKPKYAILTRIGEAHLESFKSLENIQKAKFELIESLNEDGVAILNADDERQTSYQLKSKCQVIWIGIDNKEADVVASNIKITSEGTTFDCKFKDDKKVYSFKTKLLGKMNVYNILAALALGNYLGVSKKQLQLGVLKVKMIEHRLELKNYGDLTIIDDAYNSNPIGAKAALDVLKMMPGKRIIITPGMIELGIEEGKQNYEFGMAIALACDEVILIGKTQTRPILNGLIAAKFKEENIHILNDVKLAFSLVQKLKTKDTFVLLENDLPDTFTEGK